VNRPNRSWFWRSSHTAFRKKFAAGVNALQDSNLFDNT
jgi:hypothetical protein